MSPIGHCRQSRSVDIAFASAPRLEEKRVLVMITPRAMRGCSPSARAQVTAMTVSGECGIGYLPCMIMQHE